jgi:hypothetical protein
MTESFQCLILIPHHVYFKYGPVSLGEDAMTVMEEDLRLCSVKPVLEGDRRFCFEVLSPTK